MKSHRLPLRSLLRCLVLLPLLASVDAAAQRRVIGAESTEPPAATAPAEPKPEDKPADPKGKKSKKDEKPADKGNEKPADKGNEKPADKASPAKDPKVDSKADVLAETAAEKTKAQLEAEKKKAAEAAAEAAAKAAEEKKLAEQKKLADEKKAADDKRKLENRDARLSAAKRLRQITRTVSRIGVSTAVEPGELKVGSVVELRFDITKKLEEADPRYGNLEPQKNLKMVVSIEEPGKVVTRYAAHALDAPGRYGVHFTPTKAGPHVVKVSAEGKSAFDTSLTLHVGVWPPPDFEEEEKNNVAAAGETGRSGRKLVGGQ